jgi:hypothetical protein
MLAPSIEVFLGGVPDAKLVGLFVGHIVLANFSTCKA